VQNKTAKHNSECNSCLQAQVMIYTSDTDQEVYS